MTRRPGKPRPVQGQAGPSTRLGEVQVGRIDRWPLKTGSGLQARFRRGPREGAPPIFRFASPNSVLAFANVPHFAESPPYIAEIGGPNLLGRIAGICRVAQLFQREPVS